MGRWVEMNPPPGDKPPQPDGTDFKAEFAFRRWVWKNRRHRVALAVDEMEAAGVDDKGAPALRIAYVLGVEFLDRSEPSPTDIFGWAHP